MPRTAVSGKCLPEEQSLNAFSRPFDIREGPVIVTSSIGISFYPIDGQDGDSVLKLADKALYQCKEKGRNCFTFYSMSMNRK